MKIVHEHSFGIIPLKEEKGESKVLLVLHKGGKHWSFPKGRANEGESALQTATRELKEETNLEVESLISEHVFKEKYIFFRQGEKVIKEVSYFAARVYGPVAIQAEEIIEFRWVDILEAEALLTYKETKNIWIEMAKCFFGKK